MTDEVFLDFDEGEGELRRCIGYMGCDLNLRGSCVAEVIDSWSDTSISSFCPKANGDTCICCEKLPNISRGS